MEGPADAAAAKALVPVDTLLSALNAAFCQFLSPDIVGKAILAAGRAAGLDDATLRAKMYALGAVVKEELDDQKKGKAKKARGEKGTGKGMSLYALFLTKHCAETRAEDARHPLAPGEKRDGNRLKDAISAWAGLDKANFEKHYGDLVKELKARQQQGEKLDVSAEIAKFEQAKGIPATAFLTTAKRPAEADAGVKLIKKAKVDGDSDEDEDEESTDNGAVAANGKQVSDEGSDEDSEDDEDDEEQAPPKHTPSKALALVKKPAPKPAAVAVAAAAKPAKPREVVKVKTEEGKKDKGDKKKEKKEKKK